MIQLCFTLHCLHASLTDLPAEPEGQAQAPEEPGPGQAQAVAETELELGPLGSESESEHEQQQPQHKRTRLDPAVPRARRIPRLPGVQNSSLFAESTIFLAESRFALIKRNDGAATKYANSSAFLLG